MILKQQYYYLVAGIPEIHLEDNTLSYSQAAFKEIIMEQCNQKDATLLNWLLYQSDIKNLICHLYQKPIKEDGVFTEKELESIINNESGAPQFITTFLEQFWEKKNAYSEEGWKNVLTTLYYNEALKVKNTFLNDWLQFELKLKNLTIAINGRKHNYDYRHELMPFGEFTTQLVSSKRERDFGLKDEDILVENLVKMLDHTNLLVKEKQLDDLRWKWLDEHTFFHYFTIETLLAYYIKLGIISRWLKLDVAEGRELLEKMLAKFRKNIGFSETINLQNQQS